MGLTFFFSKISIFDTLLINLYDVVEYGEIDASLFTWINVYGVDFLFCFLLCSIVMLHFYDIPTAERKDEYGV